MLDICVNVHDVMKLIYFSAIENKFIYSSTDKLA